MRSPAGDVRSAVKSEAHPSLFDALPLIAICLLPVLLYLPSMGSPFERDEGVYATVAQGLLNGQVPYRDLFDNKPPLVYAWYALSFTLFGEHVMAPRILAAVLLSLTTLSLFGQARMVFPKPVAYVAAGLFGLSTGLPFVALHANTEAYMLLPLVTSLVAFTVGVRRGGIRWFLLSGALCGAAMMTKQVAFWNLAALVGVAVALRWKTDGFSFRTFRPSACLIAGASAAVGLVAVPFALTGSLDELFYANVSYNWLYVGVLSYSERMADFASGTAYVAAIAAPLAGGAIWGFLTLVRRRKQPLDYLILAWALASAAGVATGGRFFPHYFLHLMPAAAVLTALVIYELTTKRRIAPIGRPAMAVAALMVIVSLGTIGVMYLAPRAAEQRLAESVAEQKEWESNSRQLGEYIAARTTPEDEIFNFGREAQIYFYADRSPAVRYFSDWPFWWDESTLYGTIKALRTTKPMYIIDTAQPPLFEDYAQYHPPVLMHLLEEDYDYVGRMYFADIYKLKPQP
ncbi:MAG TPA: glycosyltransferase family 39 protein [Dehalococcoidia bacterium]|nr:glycosyltransferase family 39 protein [Dehalococcoidia bacterium]